MFFILFLLAIVSFFLRFTAFCVLFCKLLHGFLGGPFSFGHCIVYPSEKEKKKPCNNLQNNTQTAVYRMIDNTVAKRKKKKQIPCNNLQNNTQKLYI
jgi:hypothetical protein